MKLTIKFTKDCEATLEDLQSLNKDLNDLLKKYPFLGNWDLAMKPEVKK